MDIQKGSHATFTCALPSSSPVTGHSQCAAGHHLDVWDGPLSALQVQEKILTSC